MNTLTIEELKELADPFRVVHQEVSDIRGLEAADFGMGVPLGVEDAQDQRVEQGVANAKFQEEKIDDFNERLKSGRKSSQARSKPKESNQGSTKSSPTSMAMSARDLDTTSQIMSRRASAEAADEQLRLRYEKKLRRFERDFLKVQQAYKDQLLVKHTALEECRAELEKEKRTRLMLEHEFSEELILKDKRMHRLQGDLGSYGVLSKKCKRWERYAEQLASAVIHACATSRPLPMEKREDGGALMGAFKGAFETLANARTHSRRHVVVERAGLIKALKLGKGIVQRLGFQEEAEDNGQNDPFDQDPAEACRDIIDEAEEEWTSDGEDEI